MQADGSTVGLPSPPGGAETIATAVITSTPIAGETTTANVVTVSKKTIAVLPVRPCGGGKGTTMINADHDDDIALVKRHWDSIRTTVLSQVNEENYNNTNDENNDDDDDETIKSVVGARRRYGKWEAQVGFAGKTHYIGLFKNRKSASRAHMLAKEQLTQLIPEITRATGGGKQKSVWKSIRDQVVSKMEQKFESGKAFPKLPPHPALPIGVTKSQKKFKASIYFFLTKQSEYVGTWKKPEHAGQAYLYAKEALIHLKSSTIGAGNRKNAKKTATTDDSSDKNTGYSNGGSDDDDDNNVNDDDDVDVNVDDQEEIETEKKKAASSAGRKRKNDDDVDESELSLMDNDDKEAEKEEYTPSAKRSKPRTSKNNKGTTKRRGETFKAVAIYEDDSPLARSRKKDDPFNTESDGTCKQCTRKAKGWNSCTPHATWCDKAHGRRRKVPPDAILKKVGIVWKLEWNKHHKNIYEALVAGTLLPMLHCSIALKFLIDTNMWPDFIALIDNEYELVCKPCSKNIKGEITILKLKKIIPPLNGLGKPHKHADGIARKGANGNHKGYPNVYVSFYKFITMPNQECKSVCFRFSIYFYFLHKFRHVHQTRRRTAWEQEWHTAIVENGDAVSTGLHVSHQDSNPENHDLEYLLIEPDTDNIGRTMHCFGYGKCTDCPIEYVNPRCDCNPRCTGVNEFCCKGCVKSKAIKIWGLYQNDFC